MFNTLSDTKTFINNRLKEICTREKLPVDQDFMFVLVLSTGASFVCFCEFFHNFWISILFYNRPKPVD